MTDEGRGKMDEIGERIKVKGERIKDVKEGE